MMSFLLVPGAEAQEQKDTTLHEVHVHATHPVGSDVKLNEFAPGQKVTTIDSATLRSYRMQSLATLISQQEPVFVKSYGFNGLATLNFRGSSAAQSTVLWNGVPIQNAALGIADISSIPVMLMNNVSLVYGSSAALWGSGNVGGALLLEDEAPVFVPVAEAAPVQYTGSFNTDTLKQFENRNEEVDTAYHGVVKKIKWMALDGGGGSYSHYMGGLKAGIAGRRVYLSVKAFGQSALNDFGYNDAAGMSRLMQNDQLQSGSVLLHAAVKMNPYRVFNVSLWLQQYDRQIPPALFETQSDKRQTDGSVRVYADMKEQQDNNSTYFKVSFISDNVHYKDAALLLDVSSRVYQLYLEGGWRHRFRKGGQLLLFVPLNLSGMSSAGSSDSLRQRKVAIAGAYEIKGLHDRLNVAVNARGEVVDSTPVALGGLDASYRVTEWLTLRANAQRTYRAPTLNELYYFPGGNTTLKPEQGWSEDAGYMLKLRAGNCLLFHDLSVFNRDIYDWIYWVGGAVWTPHNIAEVRSRGIETENRAMMSAGKWKFLIGLNTSYVIATTVSSYIYNDGSVGKQIPYTPRYNGQLNLGFEYRHLSFGYNHTYTGYRFTVTDESAYMEPFQTGNVQVSYELAWHRHPMFLSAQCNNIWDQRYQVADQRPMPGINWLAGLRVQLFPSTAQKDQ